MTGRSLWGGAVVSAFILLAHMAAAAEVVGTTSSGFPPGTRYHPDPPYRSRSQVDAFTTGPKQGRAIVLRGASATIGVVGRLAAGGAPRIVADDGTPLMTRATVAPPESLATVGPDPESGDRLMTIETPPSKPGRYRLAPAAGGPDMFDLIVHDGAPYALDVWMPSLLYKPTDPLVVYARVYNTQTGAGLPGFTVRALPHFPGVHQARLKDDGVAPDEVANDGVYTAALVTRRVFTPRQLRIRDGDVKITVRANGMVDGLPLRRVGATGFSWCVHSASVDAVQPAYLDSTEATTRIMVPLTLTAQERGHYHVEGNLVGPNDELIAFGEGEVWLTNGTHTVPLGFDADIVAAAGIAPPFTLRKVLLEEEGTGEPMMADTRENLGTVDGFTLAQLGPPATPEPDPPLGDLW